MSMPFIRRVNTRAIIVKNGLIFAVRHHGANYWATPGGGLDDNESLHKGLHREMIEETGVAPHIGRLLLVQQFHDGAKEQLEFFFHVTNADDYMAINLANTSHGAQEIAEFGFVDPGTTQILPDLLRKLDYAQIIKGEMHVSVSYQ